MDRYKERDHAYSLRRSYELVYTRIHEGGRSVVFDDNGKTMYLPISELTMLKDGKQAIAINLETGDKVMVSMPEWLAEKVGIAKRRHNVSFP